MEQKLIDLEARIIRIENLLHIQRRETIKVGRLESAWLAKLRPALEQGGPLHSGHPATSRILREYARAWRTLIAALAMPNGHPDRIQADRMLDLLGVYYIDEAGARKFFTF